MPLMIDAKIKPAGDFPAVDAGDVLMPSGKRLTEEEFGTDVELDATLSQAGQAADAGAVGAALQTATDEVNNAFTQVNQRINNLNTLPDMTEADEGKVPQVSDGGIVYRDPRDLMVGDVTLETYIGNTVDTYIEDALGGDY